MAKGFRTFRSHLNTDYVQTGLSSFDHYGFITPNEWNEFRERHITEEAKQKSEKFKELNKKNKFPHRLGPGGYKAKDEEWRKEEEEDRAAGRPEQFPEADHRTKKNGSAGGSRKTVRANMSPTLRRVKCLTE